MAGVASQGGGTEETIAQVMERRRREVARRPKAEAAGREAWAASTRTGQNLSAPRPADVVALGGRVLDARAKSSPAAGHGLGTRYGALYAPPADDLAELRRQQQAFAKTTREIADRNSWMAIPALAPAAAVLGLEGSAALAARLAGPTLKQAPVVLTERMPYLRVGDNWATRAGRRAHEEMKLRVKAKPGWEAEKNLTTKAGVRRPDILAPARKPDPDLRFQMELKPDTPTGRKAAAKAVQRYERDTKNKTRGIFYNPKDYL